MAKSKNAKADEWLLGEVRRLRSENRNLKKRLKQLQRKEHIFDESDDEDIELPSGEQNKPMICKSCFKGNLDVIDILGRVFTVCKTCGDRIKLR